MKNIQKWILNEILYKIEPSEYSKAFRLGTSIKDNAKYHRKQPKLLTIDIRDYFGSITVKKVYLFFKKLGYSKQVSTMLANLCTLEGSLPQGSPTSPMLSNLITKKMDNRIAGLCKKEGIRYTRYADDLTFSGDFQEGYLINLIEEILMSEGFFSIILKLEFENNIKDKKLLELSLIRSFKFQKNIGESLGKRCTLLENMVWFLISKRRNLIMNCYIYIGC